MTSSSAEQLQDLAYCRYDHICPPLGIIYNTKQSTSCACHTRVPMESNTFTHLAKEALTREEVHLSAPLDSIQTEPPFNNNYNFGLYAAMTPTFSSW